MVPLIYFQNNKSSIKAYKISKKKVKKSKIVIDILTNMSIIIITTFYIIK
nr:MAG TPA: hypothetical protein [Caudoviricetes sp.]